MRMIFFTLSLTISALVFAWRMDMLGNFSMANASPPAMGMAQTQDNGMMEWAMSMIGAMPGGASALTALNQDINIDGTTIQIRNGMLDQDAMAAHIGKQLEGFGDMMGGPAPRARTPAMVGSKGAKFVSSNKDR